MACALRQAICLRTNCADTGGLIKWMPGTSNHVMVADIVWLQRLAQHLGSEAVLNRLLEPTRPARVRSTLFEYLGGAGKGQTCLDLFVIDRIDALFCADLDGDITYASMAGESMTHRYDSLIGHLLPCQGHRRGQATMRLSLPGIDFDDTDLIEMLRDQMRCPLRSPARAL